MALVGLVLPRFIMIRENELIEEPEELKEEEEREDILARFAKKVCRTSVVPPREIDRDK